ncbi:MAG TPA: helix-turn-helix domain-containing protein [Gemmatimonadaceae bacterium]|nr:helix-turn-helix domain-containing protein [Gemmatimonadaceae bacterium]
MRFEPYKRTPGCSVEACLEVIGGKWKGVILHHLLGGTRRFGELRRLLPAVTQRMLTTQLRELEADGVITRTVYAEVPPRVEYSLTQLGYILEPIIELMRGWGDTYLERHPALLESDRGAASLERTWASSRDDVERGAESARDRRTAGSPISAQPEVSAR